MTASGAEVCRSFLGSNPSDRCLDRAPQSLSAKAAAADPHRIHAKQTVATSIVFSAVSLLCLCFIESQSKLG